MDIAAQVNITVKEVSKVRCFARQFRKQRKNIGKKYGIFRYAGNRHHFLKTEYVTAFLNYLKPNRSLINNPAGFRNRRIQT